MLLFAAASDPNNEVRYMLDKLKTLYAQKDRIYSWEQPAPYEIVYVSCDRSLKLYERAIRSMPWPSVYYKDNLVQTLKSKFLDSPHHHTHSHDGPPHIVLISPKKSANADDRVLCTNIVDLLQHASCPYSLPYESIYNLLRAVAGYNNRQKIRTYCQKYATSKTQDVANDDMVIAPSDTNCDVEEGLSCDERLSISQEKSPYRWSGNTMRRCSSSAYAAPGIKYKSYKCLRHAITPVPGDMSDHESRRYGPSRNYFPGVVLEKFPTFLPDSMVYKRGYRSERRSKRMNKGKNSQFY